LLGYFEAGRRPKVRSIQEVCEELEAEPDAKRTNKNNLFPEVEVGKFNILLPIVAVNIVLTGTQVISHVTALNRRIRLRHLLACQTLEAIKFIHRRRSNSRKELTLRVSPIVECCAGNIYGTWSNKSNKSLLVNEESLLIITILIIVIAEPVRE
jgi:hypothetical protein